MEIKAGAVNGRRSVNSMELQVPMEEEINLDRQMPDLDHVIGQKLRFCKEQVQVGEGNVTLKGSLLYQILYAPTGGSGRLQTIRGSIPVNQRLAMKQTPGSEMEVCAKVTVGSVKRMNSRKLSLFSVLQIRAEEMLNQKQEYIEDLAETVEKQFCKLSYSRFLQHDTTAVSIKECVSLPAERPDIERILFENVELRDVELIPGDGRLRMRGELAAFVIYEPQEEDGKAEYLKLSVPVEEECEYASEEKEAVHIIGFEVVMTEGKEAPNEDGQIRDLHLSAEMEIAYDVYVPGELTYLQDAYSKQKLLLPKEEEAQLVKKVHRQLSRIGVQESFSPAADDRILEIYPVGASVQMEKPEVVEGGIVVEGMAVCSLLYRGMNTGVQPVMAELSIPFHQQLSMEGVTSDKKEALLPQIRGEIAEYSVSILDGTKARVHAGINVSALVPEQTTCRFLTELSEEEYETESGPGMVGYILTEKDSLWELAKANRTTVEAILRINELTEEEVKPGSSLLVCRNL